MRLLSFLLPAYLLYVNPTEDPSQAPSMKDVYSPRPTAPVHEYVQVELVVRDNLAQGSGKISQVTFNNRRVALRPPDFLGNRGSFYYKLKPGRYEVKWKVYYPGRRINREEYRRTFTIEDLTDRLVYIEIKEDDIIVD